jgi:prolyl oligopeptidase
MRIPVTPLALLLTTFAFAAEPPPTAQKPASDEYHGVKVDDPYRWLENWGDPSVQAWSTAQNAYARSILDVLPHVDEIRAQVTKILSAQSVSYGGLDAKGGQLFAIKRQPPKQQPFLVVMASPMHPEAERVLVDPNVLNAKGTTAIDWYVPSPDGRLVAVSLSQGGSEAGDVHVYEVATAKEVFEVVPRAQNGTGGGSLAWLPDSKGFFYTRYPQGNERPPEDRDFYMQLYRHILGTPPAQDQYEIGKDFPKIAEVWVETTTEGLALLTFQKGDGGEFQHYVRTLDGAWHQLTHFEDRIAQLVVGHCADGKKTPIYLISLKTTPRGELRVLDVDNQAGADLSAARVLIPQGKDTLVSGFARFATNIAATDHRLYLTYQLGGPTEVRVFDLSGKVQPAPKQFAVGAIGEVDSDGDHGDEILFAATSYINPVTWFLYDPTSQTTTKTPLSQTAPVDFADCEVVREWASSKDGTKVPVNIIRRKGVKLDGSNPTSLSAYGGYGLSRTPRFSSARRVLLDQGVVIAEANIRGGGEFGDEWHSQGNLTRKQNVFDDFAACCSYLVEAGYTRPEHLAIEGGSNGGLLMGALLTQHPELVRCVVSHVGIYDMLRVELSSNGAFNIPEFGTVKNEAQFRALYAYSPYHHVREGTKYPPVLLLTGANDPRVDPMQSRKMAARLQAVGTDCLLRTTANAGHGLDSSLHERIEEAVDVDAWLFKQLGVAYQSPKP